MLKIKEIQKLNIEEGDILLLKNAGRLEAEKLKQAIVTIKGYQVPIIVFNNEIELIKLNVEKLDRKK
jgi:hypothetical protein